MHTCLENLQEIIDRAHVAVIHGCGGRDRAIPFFTCGFALHGLPEIIMIGMPGNRMFPYFTKLIHETLVAKTRVLGPFVDTESFTAATQAVHADRELAASYAVDTERYYAGKGVVPQYMQLAWADTKGRFPWDDGFEQRFVKVQPNLRAAVH